MIESDKKRCEGLCIMCCLKGRYVLFYNDIMIIICAFSSIAPFQLHVTALHVAVCKLIYLPTSSKTLFLITKQEIISIQ